MKLCLVLSLGILSLCSNVCGEECMSPLQIIIATRSLCREHRNNRELWQQVIDCHKPMTEEFMRISGEAQCPIDKHVEDPTDTNYSIEEVFFNICGLIDGSFFNQLRGGACLLSGKSSPPVMSHAREVAEVQRLWGNDVPCNIGKCILKLGLN